MKPGIFPPQKITVTKLYEITLAKYWKISKLGDRYLGVLLYYFHLFVYGETRGEKRGVIRVKIQTSSEGKKKRIFPKEISGISRDHSLYLPGKQSPSFLLCWPCR